MPNIQFVDKDDNVIGAGTKQEALEKGVIHRIVRIFLYNSKGELLIQKRGDNLASYPGRWDHSASGHVDEGETYARAAIREMEEEIGVTGVQLEDKGRLYTEREKERGQLKKRFNAVFVGTYDGDVNPNSEEASEVRWIEPETLLRWMQEKPDDFPPGFIYTLKYLRGH